MGLLSIIGTMKSKKKNGVLDNSGKTTVVVKINGEDTSVISPMLGFNIKTITYQNLSGASLFVLANEQDIRGALSPDEITEANFRFGRVASFSITYQSEATGCYDIAHYMQHIAWNM